MAWLSPVDASACAVQARVTPPPVGATSAEVGGLLNRLPASIDSVGTSVATAGARCRGDTESVATGRSRARLELSVLKPGTAKVGSNCLVSVPLGSAVRIILDTNLWSYMGDDGSVRELDSVIQQRDLQSLIPPSTLLEVVDIPHEQVRKRIIAGLATGNRRTRLITEADSYAADLVDLIKRTNPQWLLRIPNPGPPASLRTFWLKSVGQEAQNDSTRLHEHQATQRQTYDHIIWRQRWQRSELLSSRFEKQLLGSRLSELEVMADDPAHTLVPGWDGHPVAAWRANMAQLTWYHLGIVGPRAWITKEDRTMTDWVEPYVDVKRLRRESFDFGRMWLKEARIEEVPRNWLSWAVEVVQWTPKVSSGNPADAQHAAYLLDCELFLTSDKRFARALEQVGRDAPFEFARCSVVRFDSSVPVAERIAEALDRC